jgi:amino acid permease
MDKPLVKTGTFENINPLDATAMNVRPYGSTVAVAMTLNYMIGTGCFGLPYAFASAGLGLTSIFLIVGFFGSLITMNYTIEAMARAEGVMMASTTSKMPENILTYRKIDFSVIGEIFAGRMGYTIVQSVLVLYCLGSLWSYASIFPSSIASIFYSYILGDSCDAYSPTASYGCLEAYYGSMAIFAVIVLTLVLMDLGDQATIQKALSAYRIIALLLMLITMCIKLGVDGPEAISARLASRKSWAFNFHNFSAGFGPTLLALNCQYNMPDALQPLQHSEKKHARIITFVAMTISGVFYLLLGVLGAISFDMVNPLASLMWSDFTGCGNGWTPCASGSATWIGSLVHIIILMFPVVNVTSTYPLVGLTVGGNILNSLPKSITAPLGPVRARSFTRLLAAIPPLILAAIFKKLDAIFTVAGFFGFALGLIIPCWFQVIGTKFFRRVFGSAELAVTPFELPFISSLEFSSAFLIVTFFITAIALFSFVGF